MPDQLLYSLLYSALFGLTDFLGVGAPAHTLLLDFMFGQNQASPFLMLAVHLGAMAAVLAAYGSKVRRLGREKKLSSRNRRRQSDPIVQLDLRLLRTAVLPLIVSAFFYRAVLTLDWQMYLLALVVALNGGFLLIPRLMNRGNKDGRSVSRLDGVLIGLSGALAVCPGFSRVGCMYSTAAARGLDRGYALEVAALLSVPLLAVLAVLDIVAIVMTGTMVSLGALLAYMLCAAITFGAGWLSIALLRHFVTKSGITGFAYYSWGFALFTFVLYLII